MESSQSLFMVRQNNVFEGNEIKNNGNNNKIHNVTNYSSNIESALTNSLKAKDLELEDVSDDDEQHSEKSELCSGFNIESKQSIFKPMISNRGDAITKQQAFEIKKLLFGSSSAIYNEEWRNQYFEFNRSNKSLYYGLIQRKGGPCGILASLQAYIILELFFSNKINNSSQQQSNSDLLSLHCLTKAISDMLWKIGCNTHSIVATESNAIVIERSSELSYDGITERIILNSFENYDHLYNHILNCLKNNARSIGCVSLLYSCVFTRGCDRVRQDFDDPLSGTMIGRHNYCTQEMVNLFLMGRAVSNVFNNTVKCDSLILHGLTQQSQIGFLSLYEYYQSQQVGSFYKNSQYPIYVVLSESHFSLLFSKYRIESRQQFDIYYYDGLAMQDEEIKLTLKMNKNCVNKMNGQTDESSAAQTATNVSPLECVIHTKWPNATIDWNGTPPIL